MENETYDDTLTQHYRDAENASLYRRMREQDLRAEDYE